MEKYRQFADGGTGVNPFVPLWSHHKAPLALRGLKFVALLPLGLLRLAVVVCALLWLLIAELICNLIPVGLIRYPIYRVASWLGCQFALTGLGFFLSSSSDSIADHRRLKVAIPKEQGASPFNAGNGVIVISNLQGLTDILYLGLRLCPVFVFPASDGSPVEYTLIGALRRAGARRLGAPSGQKRSLAEIAKAAHSGCRGPVVVFPEGTRTNGSCILSWKPQTFDGLTSFDQSQGTALVAIEYSKTGAYTPHHTVGTAFRHIFWLCMTPWSTVKASWLPASDVSAAVKGKPAAEQQALLRSVLTRMLQGAVEVAVTADSHTEFLAYWDASQKRGYTQRQKQS